MATADPSMLRKRPAYSRSQSQSNSLKLSDHYSIIDPNRRDCLYDPKTQNVTITGLVGILMQACLNGDSDVVDYILSCYDDVDVNMRENILSDFAVRSGDLTTVKVLLTHGADPSKRMLYTALQLAYPDHCYDYRCGPQGPRGDSVTGGVYVPTETEIEEEKKQSEKHRQILAYLLTLPLMLSPDDIQQVKRSQDASLMTHLGIV